MTQENQENRENRRLLQKLKGIEDSLQSQETSTGNLKKVVRELKEVVKDLDKDMAIQSEKQSHLFYRIEQLQKEIESLEDNDTQLSNKHQDRIEKTLMVFLGGLITYIFSNANK